MKKPNNYYCHKTNPSEDSNDINIPYQIIQKIGQGAFGQVYKIFDPNTSQLMVLKKLKKISKIGLKKQGNIILQMSNSQGFVKLKQMQENKQNQYIIMSYLGDNFGNIIQQYNKINTFSMKRIAIQLIDRLKQLHQHQYVHRDLKPQNILLGNYNNPHTIYLVDFGLTIKYRLQVNKIRKMYQGIVGTARYCSIASHQGLQQFPKDDLQSLGYILIYLVTGTLPWKKVQGINDQQRFQNIYQKKKNISLQQLCYGINCIRKYFAYIKSLNINSKIDYNFITNIFKIQNNINNNYCYQFCKNQCQIKIQQNQQQVAQQNIHVGNIHQFQI